MKVGVIGCGTWGKNHAKHLSKLECKLVGISDVNPEVEEIAKGYNTNYFKNYKELISASEGVVVVTPTDTHYDIVKFALEQGKHVFVEKPASETAKKVSELASLAFDKNLVFNTGYLFRFNPAVTKLKERIYEAGQIRFIRATNIHEKEARKDSGVILNLGIHPLDVLLYICQERPYSVDCITSGSLGVEKAAIIMLDYGSYIAAVETACEAQGLKDKGISVVGERATFKVDFLEQSLSKYTNGSNPEVWKPEQKVDCLKVELEHYLNSIKKGILNNQGKEDIITTKICDYAAESAIKRKRVNITWD